MILAGPLVIGSTFLTAIMMKYILRYSGDFTWEACLLFGAIISATDPVAVVALLKELGASRRMATLIEGESLLNDGTAMVIFLILFELVKGEEICFSDIVLKFFRLSFGGPLLGILGGVILSFILSRTHNNPVLEVNATIVTSYIVFYLAEQTSLHVSGILAICTLGLFMTNYGKTRISNQSTHAVHHVWSYISFVAETLIFILAGIIMGYKIKVKQSFYSYDDYLKVLGTYVGLHIIRFSLILLFWPLLKKIGYGMNFKQVILCSYAGLRGAVGLSLALIVNSSDKVHAYVKDIIFLHTAGIALLTLIINATTTKPLINWLNLSKQSEVKINILN